MPDTSVMVPVAIRSHPSHELCRDDLARRLTRGDEMVLAAHSLAETYATITRLPPPHRLSPRSAMVLLRANFLERGRVTALRMEGYLSMLEELAGQSVSGGRTYDAIIARNAREERVSVLLTLNVRDFDGLVLPPLRLERPRAGQVGNDP